MSMSELCWWVALVWEQLLSHWSRVTHICVDNLTTIGSDNGLSPGRRQAIIWTNAGILLIGPLWTNFSEISIEISTFSFKKMRLKVSSAKWRPFCLGLNVLWSEVGDPVTWSSCITPAGWLCGYTRLIHSPNLMAVGLSVGYKHWTWSYCGWLVAMLPYGVLLVVI